MKNYISLWLMNFFVLLCWSLHASIVPSLISKNTILLGSIQFNQSVDREIELPVLYKGKEYLHHNIMDIGNYIDYTLPDSLDKINNAAVVLGKGTVKWLIDSISKMPQL